MKTVIRLLKKELQDWKNILSREKEYYKGVETDKEALKSFSECFRHIKELERAIEILKTSK